MRLVQKTFFYVHLLPIIYFSLAYTLGAGMAHYLGADIQWPAFWLGAIPVISLRAAASMLVRYFKFPSMPYLPDETTEQREKLRILLLRISFALLTVCGVAVLGMLLTHTLGSSTALLLIAELILMILYAVPPTKLEKTGYGELVLAFTMAMIVPGIGFSMQSKEFHRMIPAITFPLMLFIIGYFIADNYTTFQDDAKIKKATLLIRLGWQRAAWIHHVFITAAFLIFGLTPFMGVSKNIMLPIFLAFPFAIFQIVWLEHIIHGGRTLWKLFIPLISGTLGLLMYLLTLSFWVH